MNLILTMPITSQDRKIAAKMSQLYSIPEKQEQVYCNLLAVLAVNHYCQWMEIPTDLEASDSWDSTLQSLGNWADLSLVNLGKLECRPVKFDENIVEVPAEVWSNRIGYLAIQFDEAFTQAKLIGFLKQVQSEKIHFEQWQSLDYFLDHLERLETSKKVESRIQLSHWLQGIFEESWQELETLFSLENQNLRFNCRHNASVSERLMKSNQSQTTRVKIINLEQAEIEIALLVGLTPLTASEMNISVELSPLKIDSNLPKELQLMILDESGKSVMQAETGGSETLIFKLSGESGEEFSIKIAWGEVSITEVFVI